MSWSRARLRAVTAAYVVVLVWLGVSLPDRVPMHFDGAGDADSWGSRTEALVLWTVLGVALLGGGALLARHATGGDGTWLNLPHKDYWLAPERRRRSAVVSRATCSASSRWTDCCCRADADHRRRPPTTADAAPGWCSGPRSWVTSRARGLDRVVAAALPPAGRGLVTVDCATVLDLRGGGAPALRATLSPLDASPGRARVTRIDAPSPGTLVMLRTFGAVLAHRLDGVGRTGPRGARPPLHQREARSDAPADTATERDPGVRRGRPLDEALGTERRRRLVVVGARVGDDDRRSDGGAGGQVVAADGGRLHQGADHHRDHRVQRIDSLSTASSQASSPSSAADRDRASRRVSDRARRAPRRGRSPWSRVRPAAG